MGPAPHLCCVPSTEAGQRQREGKGWNTWQVVASESFLTVLPTIVLELQCGQKQRIKLFLKSKEYLRMLILVRHLQFRPRLLSILKVCVQVCFLSYVSASSPSGGNCTCCWMVGGTKENGVLVEGLALGDCAANVPLASKFFFVGLGA